MPAHGGSTPPPATAATTSYPQASDAVAAPEPRLHRRLLVAGRGRRRHVDQRQRVAPVRQFETLTLPETMGVDAMAVGCQRQLEAARLARPLDAVAHQLLAVTPPA